MIAQLANLQYDVPMLITAAGALLILHYLLGALFRPLRDVKGPTLARYTRLWEAHKNWQGQLEHVTVALHKKYGSLISPMWMEIY
jgi:hypothetical protein